MQKLLNNAALACDQLNDHISGVIELSPADVEGRKELIKLASKKSLYFFSKEVLGFDLLTPQTHKRWADDLQKKFTSKNRILRIKPRGTYKTTLFGEAFLLWVWAVVSPKIKIGYFSANQALLDEISAHLDYFLGFKTDSLYAFVFGIKRDKTSQKNTNEVFNIVGRDKKKKGTSLLFRTAGGSTNGIHPNLVIIDDPMDKSDRESEAVRLKKERWLDSIYPLLKPIDVVYDGIPFKMEHLIMISTRWHLSDLVAYIKKKSNRFDIEEEGVYHPIEKDDEGRRKLTYPELFTHESIELIMQDLTEVFFACQYLNEPLPDGLRLFKLERIKLIDVNSEATFSWKQGTNYMFLDPAKGTKEGDFAALIFANRLNGKTVFFDAIDVKMGLDEIIAMGVKRAKIYNVKIFVFETNGTNLIKSSIKRQLMQVGHRCRVIDIHETRNKPERIASMQPDLLFGDNYFREDYAEAYPELMKQLTLYPAYGPVDFPDVIEKCITYLSLNSASSFSDGGSSSSETVGGQGKRGNSLVGGLGKKTNW